MSDSYTPAQQRLIAALTTITGLDKPCFAPLDEGQRMTITHNEFVYVLEQDGTISDEQTLAAWEAGGILGRNASKEQTLLDAIELDETMNREERCPTGDDYNTVMALVRSVVQHGPLMTFDAKSQSTALRLLVSIEDYTITLNGLDVQVEGATEVSLIVRNWTPLRGPHGKPRIIAWADIKTIHVH